MATMFEKAREAGIEVRTHGADYRTPCPVCSPNRKKKKDPCLHITIDREAVRVCCFHCDFKGVFKDDDERRDAANPRGPRDRRGTGRPARPGQRAPRWW